MIAEYGAVEAEFLNPGVSDHSPILIQYTTQVISKPKPFKLYNIILEHKDFTGIVVDTWRKKIHGTKMLTLSQKLKILKHDLQALNTYLVS